MKMDEEEKIVEEEGGNPNDWCFVCKDGGEMRICDHKDCQRSFHPECVGKDDSFLTSDERWVCDCHTCDLCNRSPHLYCFTCTYSVCRRCLPAGDISEVKGKYGFCIDCLKVAVLIEGNKDYYNSDGEKGDFKDMDTSEGLFMDYYKLVKNHEGFESKDILAAEEKLKIKNEHSEKNGEDEDQISDYDEHVKKRKSKHRKKKSQREKSASKTLIESSKIEFIGWASKPLIEFLTSIGKSTKEKLSQHDVTSIIDEYAKENKLLHKEKRKVIVCDNLLWSVFRRKKFSRTRLYELLETHFPENHDESEEEELGYDSEDESAGIPNTCKRQRKLDTKNKSPKLELDNNVRQSCFAAITVENIKLVYLKRELLHKLLKQPETFEEKVTGCFVRVRSDPCGSRSNNSYQLMQVQGVKGYSSGEINMQVSLLVSAMPEDIPLKFLSDADFSKEECEDLRQKIVSGQLKRPTVLDLQHKAKILHEDLTNHWISKELALLENLIDQANEKGWRRELFEYRERRKKLQNPSEISKLLGNVPTVMPEVNEQLSSNSGDNTNYMNSDKGSPQCILRRNSSVPKDGWLDDKASGKKQLISEGSLPIDDYPPNRIATRLHISRCVKDRV